MAMHWTAWECGGRALSPLRRQVLQDFGTVQMYFIVDAMKKKVGKRIQMLRMEHNITQDHMADLLCISTSAYCKIEYGETDLTLTRIRRLAEIFGMPEQELAMRLLSSSDSAIDTDPGTQRNNLVLPTSLEKMISEMIVQNKEYKDKVIQDISRLEDRLELISSRLQTLEGFHLKD